MFGPSTVFISYRRSDAEEAARSLFEALRARLRGREVFFDTNAIEWGADFRRVVEERIRRSAVVLVVVGPGWASARNERGPRLAQPDDPVAFELRTALQAGCRLLPVRVRGAEPPAEADLPEEFRALPYRNSPRVHGDSFDRDVNELYRQIIGEVDDPTFMERLRAFCVGLPLATAAIAVLLLAATWTGAFGLLQLDAHAQRLLLAASGPNRGEPVALVTIDAASEQALGRAYGPAEAVPAWRADHARLIDAASRSGASAVAFDFYFETSHAGADAALAAAVQRAAARVPPMRVVFGVRRFDGDAPALAAPLRAVGQWGSLCLAHQGGGAVWWAPLAVAVAAPDADGDTRPAERPALALAAVAPGRLLEADMARRELRFDATTRGTPVRYSQVERQRLASAGCLTVRAGEDKLNLLLRVSPAGHWGDARRHLSYAELVNGPQTEPRLRGRVVLVGVTALGQAAAHDDVRTVLDGFVPRSVYGVELHADALATLAGGRVPQLPTAGEQLAMTLGSSVAGALCAFWLYGRPAWWRRLALLAVYAAIIAIAWLLARGGLLLDLVNAAVSLWLGATGVRVVQALAHRLPRLQKAPS